MYNDKSHLWADPMKKAYSSLTDTEKQFVSEQSTQEAQMLFNKLNRFHSEVRVIIARELVELATNDVRTSRGTVANG